MRALHGTALYLLLAGCGTPDRWSLSGGSTVSGGLESKDGLRDFDSQWVEVGVSGPLGSAPETGLRQMPPYAPQEPAAPVAPPAQSEGIPWTELALLAAGALGGKGSEIGYRKVKAHRERKKQES